MAYVIVPAIAAFIVYRCGDKGWAKYMAFCSCVMLVAHLAGVN